MNANTTTERDDLFTIIHKGLRLGLFDITVQAGRTDWADPAQVTDLGERWHGLLTLLRAHGDHENQHILRLLDTNLFLRRDLLALLHGKPPDPSHHHPDQALLAL